MLTSRKRKAAEEAYAKMCRHLGIQLAGESEKTAQRVVRMLLEMTASSRLIHDCASGKVPALPFNFTMFASRGDDIIAVRDVSFVSLCAHHHVPFFGTISVGYLPDKFIVGLSKIPRLVDFYAKTPTLQEELTRRIATDMESRLKPLAICVLSKARHSCVCARTGHTSTETVVTTVLGKEVFKLKDEIIGYLK